MTFAVPLLHIVQSVATVTTVDGLVVALAVLAFLGWLVFATRPWRAPRRTKRRVAMVAGSLLVALAIMPSVLPYDHLFAHVDAHHGSEAAEVHASHCHDTPGTCADAPLTAGPGQLLLGGPLMPAPALISVLLVLATPLLVGMTLRPEVRPPLRASFA